MSLKQFSVINNALKCPFTDKRNIILFLFFKWPMTFKDFIQTYQSIFNLWRLKFQAKQAWSFFEKLIMLCPPAHIIYLEYSTKDQTLLSQTRKNNRIRIYPLNKIYIYVKLLYSRVTSKVFKHHIVYLGTTRFFEEVCSWRNKDLFRRERFKSPHQQGCVGLLIICKVERVIAASSK